MTKKNSHYGYIAAAPEQFRAMLAAVYNFRQLMNSRFFLLSSRFGALKGAPTASAAATVVVHDQESGELIDTM
jgi:hypothetical protein